MKRFLLIVCAVVMAAMALSAQNPIRWRMTVKMTSATEGVVTLRALVDKGWHLYSTSLPDDGPRPTSISFKASPEVTLKGEPVASRKPVEVDDPMFGMKLAWWDANVDFVQKFKVKNKKGAKIEASVSFMGCNDMNCMPPKTEKLTYIFK